MWITNDLYVKRGVSLWTSKQMRNQNVLLLSLAEREGPSDLTWWVLLLLISRPWNRPRGSWCIESERSCNWAAESIGCCWNCCCICMLRDSFGVGWVGLEKKADWLYWTCCIAKLYESVVVDSSPVAILSLSTSCFSASLRAAWFTREWVKISSDCRF